MKVRFNQTVGTKIPVIMMTVKMVINNDSDNKHGHSKWGIVENSLIMEKGHQIVEFEATTWSWSDS